MLKYGFVFLMFSQIVLCMNLQYITCYVSSDDISLGELIDNVDLENIQKITLNHWDITEYEHQTKLSKIIYDLLGMPLPLSQVFFKFFYTE